VRTASNLQIAARRWGAGIKRGNHEVITRDLFLEGGLLAGVCLVERGADDRDGAARVPGG
jgi:hypothetical protein